MHTTNNIRPNDDLNPNQKKVRSGDVGFRGNEQPPSTRFDNRYDNGSDVDPMWSGSLREYDNFPSIDKKEHLYHQVQARVVEMQTMLAQLHYKGIKGERVSALQKEIKIARDLIADGWQKLTDAEVVMLNQWLDDTQYLTNGDLDDSGKVGRKLRPDADVVHPASKHKS
jgi:hypothetical protein